MDENFNRPPMNPTALSNAVDMFQTMRPNLTAPQMPMARASGGTADKIAREKSTPCHTGLITMAVGGRTDHIPMNVLEGSYVLPADIVSGLGEGNTLAGSRLIENMFKSGPFGVSIPTTRFTEPKYPSAAVPYAIADYLKFDQIQNPQKEVKQSASGGPVHSSRYRPVPIIAAGGEYVIDPDVVKRLGGGDITKGHDYLDAFVKGVRQNLIKTLSKLPGPKRD